MGIKIQDVAYVRFSAPDLDAMEEFLAEFGMIRSGRAADRLYMRGLNGDPFLSFPSQKWARRDSSLRLRSRISQGSRDSRSRGEDLDRRVDSDHLQCSSHVRLLSYNLFALNYAFTLLWARQRRLLVREAIAHSRRNSESQLKGIMKDTGKGSIALESKATKRKSQGRS
jgi:hypothetical protein